MSEPDDDAARAAAHTAYCAALSSRAWAAYVARQAAAVLTDIHRALHEIGDEIAAHEAELAELAAASHELEHRQAEWKAFAATPGAMPAAARGTRFTTLWEALPDYLREWTPESE
jgi:hypothetical protein